MQIFYFNKKAKGTKSIHYNEKEYILLSINFPLYRCTYNDDADTRTLLSEKLYGIFLRMRRYIQEVHSIHIPHLCSRSCPLLPLQKRVLNPELETIHRYRRDDHDEYEPGILPPRDPQGTFHAYERPHWGQ